MKDNNSLYLFFVRLPKNLLLFFNFLGFSHFIITMVSLLKYISGSQQIKIYVQITAMKAGESTLSVISQCNRSSDQSGVSSILEGPFQAVTHTRSVLVTAVAVLYVHSPLLLHTIPTCHRFIPSAWCFSQIFIDNIYRHHPSFCYICLVIHMQYT